MRNLYYALKCCFIFVVSMISFQNFVKSQNPVLAYQSIVTGLSSPVDAVVAPGDGRLFIAQQNGLIKIRDGGTLVTFANLSSILTNPLGNEQGLLSLAFHPNYATNRYFFVLYTGSTGAITLARYRRDATNPNTIEAGGTVLLSIPKPTPLSSYSNHNGGKINFGPDGYLYMSTGDGGSSGDPGNRAQNRAELLGKMLRLDVNSFATTAPFYDIPPTNPYASAVDGFRDEIYAYGLRNPWRWSFDRATGDMWIADVGQSAWEEINWTPAGAALGGNFGWRCYEGNHIYSGGGGCTPTDTISPVFEYGRSMATGGASVTGGYVYRGSASPALQGFYVVADYISGNLWKIKPNGSGGWQVYLQNGLANNVAGFAEGANGELYAINRGGGRIDSLIVLSVVPVNISQFNVVAKNGYNELKWTTNAEINTSRFHIEFSTNGNNFSRVGTVAANGVNSGRAYQYTHITTEKGYLYYRLAIEDADGSVTYSEIKRILSASSKLVSVYPTLVQNNKINVDLFEPAQRMQLVNSTGAVVYQKSLQGQSGNLAIILPSLPKGLYIVAISAGEKVSREKIIIQ